MMLEFHTAPGLTKRPERVYVPIARPVPVAKLNPQFERCPGLTHELRLIQTEHVVKALDLRQRRFADPDSSNLVGFNERNSIVFRTEFTPDAGCTHPAGRAAAHNDDAERP